MGSRLVVALSRCLVAVVLFTSTGCTSGGSDESAGRAEAADRRQVEVLRATPFSAAAVAVVTEVLRRSGVGVHDDEVEVTTGSPVRVTRWQARNLAAEAANGGGVAGEVLGSLASAPAGAPPVQYLVAAWVKAHDSPGARFSRELMGEQDWRAAGQIMYPSLVTTLFLADASAASASASGPVRQSMALAQYRAGGPCTFAATFVQHAVAEVAAALKVSTSGGGFVGFLGRIWNVAVDLASNAIRGLVTAVTKPVVDLIADAFGVVATIAQLSSFIVKWRADMRANPGHTRFGVDGEVVTGQFVLTVAQDQLPIPAVIVDCAAAVDVDLRNAGSAAGSKVAWREGRADLSSRVSADAALAQDKTARYRYQTRQESAEVAKSPRTESPALVLSASVQRNDIQKVRELFTKLLFAQIPSSIRSVVENLAQPLLVAANDKLEALTNVTASTRSFVTYHVPGPTPSPAGATAPPAGNSGKAGRIPTICPSTTEILRGFPRPGVNAGPWEFDGEILPPNLLPPGAKTCGYSAWIGPKDPVTGFQQVEQVGLFMMRGAESTPSGATTATVRGADRAWFEGALRVVVGDQTLVVEIRIRETGDLNATAISVAEVVLGTR